MSVLNTGNKQVGFNFSNKEKLTCHSNLTNQPHKLLFYILILFPNTAYLADLIIQLLSFGFSSKSVFPDPPSTLGTLQTTLMSHGNLPDISIGVADMNRELSPYQAAQYTKCAPSHPPKSDDSPHFPPSFSLSTVENTTSPGSVSSGLSSAPSSPLSPPTSLNFSSPIVLHRSSPGSGSEGLSSAPSSPISPFPGLSSPIVTINKSPWSEYPGLSVALFNPLSHANVYSEDDFAGYAPTRKNADGSYYGAPFKRLPYEPLPSFDRASNSGHIAASVIPSGTASKDPSVQPKPFNGRTEDTTSPKSKPQLRTTPLEKPTSRQTSTS